MSVAQAFVVRDFRVAWSYRFTFFFQYFGILLSLISTRFLAEIVVGPAALDEYGGDYFSFALVGTAVQIMVTPAVTVFRASVREAQVMGTFEATLMTRARPTSVILSSGLYALAQSFVQLPVIVIVVGVLLGAQLDFANLGLVLVILALTVATFAGIGLLSTAFTIAFKQNEPISMAVLSISLLLSGVVYPTSVLPGPLEFLAQLLPLTHALEVTRALFLENAEVTNLGGHLAALIGCTVLLPVSLIVLGRSIEWAKRSGSLGQY